MFFRPRWGDNPEEPDLVKGAPWTKLMDITGTPDGESGILGVFCALRMPSGMCGGGDGGTKSAPSFRPKDWLMHILRSGEPTRNWGVELQSSIVAGTTGLVCPVGTPPGGAGLICPEPGAAGLICPGDIAGPRGAGLICPPRGVTIWTRGVPAIINQVGDTCLVTPGL